MRANRIQAELEAIPNPFDYDIPKVRHRFRWSQESRCSELTKQQAAKMFFGRGGRPKNYPDYKRYCDECPVMIECRTYAIVHKEKGIWGGTTEDQRSNLPVPYKNFLTQVAKVQGWFEKRLLPELLHQPVQTLSVRQEESKESLSLALDSLGDFFGLEDQLGA